MFSYSSFEAFIKGGLVDSLYYDIEALSFNNIARSLYSTVPDGGLLVVYPLEVKQEPIKFYHSLTDFFLDETTRDIDTVAIAGVGSSSFGTAALAADIANEERKPVIGIVSGKGMDTLIKEGLEGFFVEERAFNINESAAWVHKLYGEALSMFGLHDIKYGSDSPSDYVEGVPASETLINLITQPGYKIKRLVGHSKGALDIGNALNGVEALVDSNSALFKLVDPILTQLEVVTFGCPINLPNRYLNNCDQFIGAWDTLGKTNATIDLKDENALNEYHVTFVGQATHSTNPVIPTYMAVSEELSMIDQQEKMQKIKKKVKEVKKPLLESIA